MHNKYIVHRDLKPDNMLLNPVDNLIKIADFGSAKVLTKDGPTKSVAYMITRYYRPPEMILGFSVSGDAFVQWCQSRLYSPCNIPILSSIGTELRGV